MLHCRDGGRGSLKLTEELPKKQITHTSISCRNPEAAVCKEDGSGPGGKRSIKCYHDSEFSSAFINKEVIADLNKTHCRQNLGEENWISAD